eukprot:Skav205868  [mRNA]  locus=scaffold766:185237:186466:+ [translate_table: standard]
MRADTRTLQFENQKTELPFFWSCCSVAVESPEIIEDGRGRARQGVGSLLEELFNLQDLNSNGLLEESELIELNEIIAVLHYGTDFDRGLLQKKYRKLFRLLECTWIVESAQKLDSALHTQIFEDFLADGFFSHAVLSDYDPDTAAQEMILEQFIAAWRRRGVEMHCDHPIAS